MNLPKKLTARVEMEVRDYIQIVIMLIGFGALYGGMSMKLSALDEHVTTLDSRLWELQGRRAAFLPHVSTMPASFTVRTDATHITTRKL